ncbi:hypothetical protein NQ314_003612 [Rhamnusium bicolor]|uniref:Uncharacterized protein n=1 Tax=Rhamnusium bicolor TaxID=1586634 RepID=A0AAV8ZNZ5_9CUCU|nr:hypothetical protein NQ314_003612 [Rhamnusium bicolor]
MGLNRTSKKLCLRLSVSRHEFKIRKDNRLDSDPLRAAKIALLPHESRVIIVSFIPTKIGAAVDELNFTSLDPNLQQTKKQCIRLFGYGGYGKVELHNVTKDTTGKFWLSLGKLDDQNTLKQNFSMKNMGTVPSFAHISFHAKELFAYANVKIVPSSFVLIPNQQIEVEVTYIPSIDDHKVFRQSSIIMADLGNIFVISGTEVNRGRLRRLSRKCTEKGLEVDEVSNILKEKIQGELMPLDLSQFRESPNSLREILKLLTRNEITLTLEQDPEQTLMPQYPDDSGMFQSLCQDSTSNSTAFYLENSTVPISCKLEPTSIILTPPTKNKR